MAKYMRRDVGLNKRDATREYVQHLDMIRGLAWKFAARTSMYSYEELFGIAQGELFMKAAATYRSATGAAFGTFLNRVIQNGLGNLLLMNKADVVRLAVCSGGESADADDRLTVIADQRETAPDWRMRMVEWLTELGDEARAVVSIVLDAPVEVAELFGTATVKTQMQSKRVIREHLETRGWARREIDFAFAEIRDALARGI